MNQQNALLMALCPIRSRKAVQLNVLRISGICYVISICCHNCYYKGVARAERLHPKQGQGCLKQHIFPLNLTCFNPFFFCLRQRRIPFTVYGRAGLAGTSSISAYCLFGVVHISFNVNQVIEFIPTV